MCVCSGGVSCGSGEHAHPHHRGSSSGRSGADHPHRVSDRQEEDTRRIPDHLIVFIIIILSLHCDQLQLDTLEWEWVFAVRSEVSCSSHLYVCVLCCEVSCCGHRCMCKCVCTFAMRSAGAVTCECVCLVCYECMNVFVWMMIAWVQTFSTNWTNQLLWQTFTHGHPHQSPQIIF